jgi:hypothetical protein
MRYAGAVNPYATLALHPNDDSQAITEKLRARAEVASSETEKRALLETWELLTRSDSARANAVMMAGPDLRALKPEAEAAPRQTARKRKRKAVTPQAAAIDVAQWLPIPSMQAAYDGPPLPAAYPIWLGGESCTLLDWDEDPVISALLGATP